MKESQNCNIYIHMCVCVCVRARTHTHTRAFFLLFLLCRFLPHFFDISRLLCARFWPASILKTRNSCNTMYKGCNSNVTSRLAPNPYKTGHRALLIFALISKTKRKLCNWYWHSKMLNKYGANRSEIRILSDFIGVILTSLISFTFS